MSARRQSRRRLLVVVCVGLGLSSQAAGAGPALRGFVQQGAKLAAGDVGAQGDAHFGSSVAVSSDGKTALVGGPEDRATGGGAGAAWVLVRSGKKWVKQATLIPRNAAKGVAFGAAVALSADANTALIGGPVETFSVGAGMNSQSPILSAVWVFVRSGSTWTEQAKLTPNDVIFGEPSFGASVALSADGDTAMFGGPAEAWIFTRSGTSWTQQGKKLAPRDGSAGARFGESVALAADGSTALIGGTGFANNAGAAWVFARSGGTWRQQGPRLTPRDADGESFFGEAVSLSATGGTALIGGPYDGGSGTALGSGAAWVFARSGSVWQQRGAKLVPTGIGVKAPDSFGSSVALSGNGGTALVGGARAGATGSGKNAPPGSAWIFARSGGTWKQRSALGPSGGVKSAHGVAFGQSVALTSAGDAALVGGPEDASAGAVWTFVPAPSA